MNRMRVRNTKTIHNCDSSDLRMKRNWRLKGRGTRMLLVLQRRLGLCRAKFQTNKARWWWVPEKELATHSLSSNQCNKKKSERVKRKRRLLIRLNRWQNQARNRRGLHSHPQHHLQTLMWILILTIQEASREAKASRFVKIKRIQLILLMYLTLRARGPLISFRLYNPTTWTHSKIGGIAKVKQRLKRRPMNRKKMWMYLLEIGKISRRSSTCVESSKSRVSTLTRMSLMRAKTQKSLNNSLKARKKGEMFSPRLRIWCGPANYKKICTWSKRSMVSPTLHIWKNWM